MTSPPHQQKPYLVTGAAGFTGSNLVKHLIAQGIPVRAMVRRPDSISTVSSLGIEVVVADLVDPDSLHAAVAGTAGVYHIAAAFRRAGVPDSYFFDVNVTGTKALFDACIAAQVPRIIYCSTIGVISNTKQIPADESIPYCPGDPYQESKVQGEQLALKYFRSGTISGNVIRPAMIYGPGDTRLLKIFKMVAERKFFYLGDGRSHVHFIDVIDLAQAFQLAMENKERNGEVYIIAGERSFRLSEVVEIIADFFHVRAPTLHLPVKPMQWLGGLCESICTPFGISPPLYRRRVDFFTKERSFSIGKAIAELGFQPRRNSVDEIRAFCQWCLESGEIQPQ